MGGIPRMLIHFCKRLLRHAHGEGFSGDKKSHLQALHNVNYAYEDGLDPDDNDDTNWPKMKTTLTVTITKILTTQASSSFTTSHFFPVLIIS